MTVGPKTAVSDAARIMTEAGVSSVLVVDDSGLVGLVTDRDPRRRIVAACRDLATPVSEVMTRGVITELCSTVDRGATKSRVLVPAAVR